MTSAIVSPETLLATLDWLEWPMAIYDAQDRLVYFNRAYGELRSAIGGAVALGARWDDLVSASVRAGSIPEARGQEEAWLAKRRQQRGRYDVVRQIPDGRWFQVRERRLPDTGLIAIWYDVSELMQAKRDAERELVERRRAESTLATINRELEGRVLARTQALQDKERFLSAVIENISDAIFVHRDDAIIFANRACLELFGATSPDQVIGPSPLRFYPEQCREAVAQRFRQVMTGLDQRAPAEMQVLRLDGTLADVETQSVSYLDEGSRTIISIVRDITRRKDTELQLAQSLRMDAIGQLTGGVAHDFNNILSIILGTAELLADAVADRPKLLTYARTIEAAAGRGADMTRKLLAYARRQPLRPMSTDVNGLVVEAVKFLRPTLGEHIEVESILSDDAWPALVDAAQLSTALLNLAVNARDAMPDGGKLMVETANVMLDATYADAHAEVTPGPYVMIAVSDTGTGMSREVLARAFEPFFTTKDVGRGTGLGLSQVFGFVKQSGGHINIFSEERVGTSIKIYLPRSADSAIFEAPTVSVAAPGGRETILVVEDDAMVRAHAIGLLQSLGYTTIEAENGRHALDLIDSPVSFDLVFTDVVMPGGMTGLQLSDHVRQRRPEARVLYTSGYAEAAIMRHGRLDEGASFLMKPYRKRDLAQKVRELLG